MTARVLTQEAKDALNFAAGALGAAGHEVTHPALLELLEQRAMGEISTEEAISRSRQILQGS